MGVEKAAQYGLVGFIADRVLGTGLLGTLGAALWGGLMTPDAGEMSTAYDKRRATVRDSVQNFGGFDISGFSIFGDTKDKDPERVKPSRQRAEQEATRREKKDGWGWGKILLTGAAAWLGVNILDNVVSGPFSGGWFSPFGNFGNFGSPIMSMGLDPWSMGFGNYGGGGILQNVLGNVLGINPWGILC